MYNNLFILEMFYKLFVRHCSNIILQNIFYSYFLLLILMKEVKVCMEKHVAHFSWVLLVYFQITFCL